jgi:polyhydroxybutyrate depolymerase
MTADRLAACASTRPVPVLEIHGTADLTVPYTGGTTLQFVAIPTLLANWVQRNGANPTPTVTMVPDTNPNDGSTAERSVWTGGRNGSIVEHYRIIGGGHTWPGTAFPNGVTNRDINASREVWRFLRPFRLSRLSLSSTASRSEASFTVQPNPATDAVIIRAAGKLSANSLVVHDALGRSVAVRAQPNQDGSLRVATGTWRNGVYLLRLQLANGQTLQQKLVKE